MRSSFCLLAAAAAVLVFLMSGAASSEGFRTSVGSGAREFPVVVVKGTPYEMGYAFGSLLKSESETLLNRFLQLGQASGDERYKDETLDAAWKSMEPYISERFKQEMQGLSDATGVSMDIIRRAHMIPVVSNYSCSSIALWGSATANGHLYQTRNLDWNMEVRAHEFACLVVYLPNEGIPHVNVSFAGYVGCNTGMNAEGIALSEMGDSKGSSYPFNLDGVHFTILFRDLLYDAHNLDEAVGLMKSARKIKDYHFVIGDGKTAKKAVKILQKGPNLTFWTDNDKGDELFPNVLKDGVYVDEGRGAFPYIKNMLGQHDDKSMAHICTKIPIKGSNVLDVVYDATDLKLWVSYAKGDVEAYLQPFVSVDLNSYLTFKPDERVKASVGKPAPVTPAQTRTRSLAFIAVPLLVIGAFVAWRMTRRRA